MIDVGRDSLPTLRLTSSGLVIAAALFVSFALYCKMHGLFARSDVPLGVSVRWAASATSCWCTLLIAGWACRARLRAGATGSVRAQAGLFAGAMLLMLITDMLAMQIASGVAQRSVEDAAFGAIRRAYAFAPMAAMLSAIMMLSLIVEARRRPLKMATSAALPPVMRGGPASAPGEWVDFPEAPLLRLRADDIRLIRSAGNYSEIACRGRTWLVRAPLGALAARLEPRGFHRVHRRTVVNGRHVRRISRDASGRALIHLDDDHAVSVGRSFRDAVDRLAPRTGEPGSG